MWTTRVCLLIAAWAYLSYSGTATHSIWLALELYDSFLSLRTIRPDGRRIGLATRRKAMREALVSWTVFITVQSGSWIPDRFLSWMPLYGTARAIICACYLLTRAPSSAGVYRSIIVPALNRYETPIDLTILLIHSLWVLVVHYTLVQPLKSLQSAVTGLPRRVLSGLLRIFEQPRSSSSQDDSQDDSPDIDDGDELQDTPGKPVCAETAQGHGMVKGRGQALARHRKPGIATASGLSADCKAREGVSKPASQMPSFPIVPTIIYPSLPSPPATPPSAGGSRHSQPVTPPRDALHVPMNPAVRRSPRKPKSLQGLGRAGSDAAQSTALPTGAGLSNLSKPSHRVPSLKSANLPPPKSQGRTVSQASRSLDDREPGKEEISVTAVPPVSMAAKRLASQSESRRLAAMEKPAEPPARKMPRSRTSAAISRADQRKLPTASSTRSTAASRSKSVRDLSRAAVPDDAAKVGEKRSAQKDNEVDAPPAKRSRRVVP